MLVLGGVNVAEGLNSDMGTDKDPGKVLVFCIFSTLKVSLNSARRMRLGSLNICNVFPYFSFIGTSLLCDHIHQIIYS